MRVQCSSAVPAARQAHRLQGAAHDTPSQAPAASLPAAMRPVAACSRKPRRDLSGHCQTRAPNLGSPRVHLAPQLLHRLLLGLQAAAARWALRMRVRTSLREAVRRCPARRSPAVQLPAACHRAPRVASRRRTAPPARQLTTASVWLEIHWCSGAKTWLSIACPSSTLNCRAGGAGRRVWAGPQRRASPECGASTRLLLSLPCLCQLQHAKEGAGASTEARSAPASPARTAPPRSRARRSSP